MSETLPQVLAFLIAFDFENTTQPAQRTMQKVTLGGVRRGLLLFFGASMRLHAAALACSCTDCRGRNFWGKKKWRLGSLSLHLQPMQKSARYFEGILLAAGGIHCFPACTAELKPESNSRVPETRRERTREQLRDAIALGPAIQLGRRALSQRISGWPGRTQGASSTS